MRCAVRPQCVECISLGQKIDAHLGGINACAHGVNRAVRQHMRKALGGPRRIGIGDQTVARMIGEARGLGL